MEPVEEEEVSTEIEYPVKIDYTYVVLVSFLTLLSKVRGWYTGSKNHPAHPLEFTRQGFRFKPPRQSSKTVLYTDITQNPRVADLPPKFIL